MQKPILYILCGLPYSGKTFIAKNLTRKFGWSYVSIDVIREQLGFSWEENDKVTEYDWRRIFEQSYADMIKKLQSGKSVIYDSTNHDADGREKLRRYAAKAGYDAKVIFIDVPEEVVGERWKQNQEITTRSHISKELVQWTIEHLETPGEEENVLRYDPSMNVDNWLEKIIAVPHPEKPAG